MRTASGIGPHGFDPASPPSRLPWHGTAMGLLRNSTGTPGAARPGPGPAPARPHLRLALHVHQHLPHHQLVVRAIKVKGKLLRGGQDLQRGRGRCVCTPLLGWGRGGGTRGRGGGVVHVAGVEHQLDCVLMRWACCAGHGSVGVPPQVRDRACMQQEVRNCSGCVSDGGAGRAVRRGGCIHACMHREHSHACMRLDSDLHTCRPWPPPIHVPSPGS